MLLVHYFDPLTRRVKLLMLEWALKNIDDFIERVLGKASLKEVEYRMQVEEILRSEVIFTTMQLCEDLVYVISTYKYTSSDPVAIFRTKIKAPEFFSFIKKVQPSDLLDWLSWPPEIDTERLPDDGVKPFSEFLDRVKSFYYGHLTLYNSYKHGNRIAYMTWIDPDETPYPAMLYFPVGEDRNTATVTRSEDVSKEFKLAESIIYVASIVKDNWLIRRRDEESGKFTLALPSKVDLKF